MKAKLKKALSPGGKYSSWGIICIPISSVLLFTANCENIKDMRIKQVIIYYQGKQKLVKPTSKIKETIQKCLNSVVDSMELIITNNKVQHIKKELSGVEIVFYSKIEFKLKPLGRKVRFSRIFIPTSGKFSGVLFLGNENSGYSPYPPYNSINCKIQEAIKTLR